MCVLFSAHSPIPELAAKKCCYVIPGAGAMNCPTASRQDTKWTAM